MEAKCEILWSTHFHARLMERFGLVMGEHHRIEIEDIVKNDPPFCIIDSPYGLAHVYGAVIDGHDVMVVFRVSINTIVTAYRFNWFMKKDDVWIKKRNPKYDFPKRKPDRKPRINIKEIKEELSISELEEEL